LTSNGNVSMKERVIENCSLNAFEMHKWTNQGILNRELLISLKYQVNLKEIKCLLQWWQKHESMFPRTNFLAYNIKH
jgi:hypothetical protein